MVVLSPPTMPGIGRVTISKAFPCVSHRFESREIVLEYFVIRVSGIVFDGADDHVGATKRAMSSM